MKKFTPLHRLNLSKALKGKRKLKEVKEKISQTLQGRHLSKETKRRMALREVRKGELYQAAKRHYLEEHSSIPGFLDKRKILRECHLCGKEIR